MSIDLAALQAAYREYGLACELVFWAVRLADDRGAQLPGDVLNRLRDAENKHQAYTDAIRAASDAA